MCPLSTTRVVPPGKFLYYKNESQVQMLLESATFLEVRSHVSFPFLFWKVPRHTNAYVSNKWPLKLPCAYLNTQESSRTETFLKRIQDG
ncbi:hypothetical protein T07_15099 [Trichinella nelsoni]|uniref:Uncharacterized protein n=1 Tax=Trichinella nelsoni TaxID=6336 RepID=A0A0V0S1D9_9BILA|nr:hypothetical protein T07_15099 [Trichinella nelsoni]